MIPVNSGPRLNKTRDNPCSGFSGADIGSDTLPATGKTIQQLPDIHVEFHAASSPHRRVQANDQITGWQAFTLPPKNLAHNALDQISPIGPPDQLLGHRYAQPGCLQLGWAIVQRIETATK